jgi:hypothetical protein
MKYKILKKSGVITERNPIIVEPMSTQLHFEGCDGMTAIIRREEDEWKEFSTVENGCCTIPSAFFMKECSYNVAITALQGAKPIRCEPLKVINRGDVYILIPDDNNLPLEVARLKVDFDELAEKYRNLTNEFKIIANRLSELEGFDI